MVAQVVPSRRGRPHGGEARWDVLEFLARVVDHVPEPSQQMVRYWGFYANAARGKRRKAALVEDTTQTPSRQDEDEFTRRACLSWAKLIRRVYEIDPLLCPSCPKIGSCCIYCSENGLRAGRRRQCEPIRTS